MIAFTEIVGDEFGHRPAKMAFTERDHLVQAFLLDRADKPLRVGVAVRRSVRCLNDSDTSCLEEVRNGDTPPPISVANQDRMRAELPEVRRNLRMLTPLCPRERCGSRLGLRLDRIGPSSPAQVYHVPTAL